MAGEDNDNKDEGQEDGGQPKTFTQEEMNEIMGRTRREAREVATREATAKILETLGLEKIEDLKTVVDAHRAASDKDKTETERLTSSNTALDAENRTLKARIAASDLTDTVVEALVEAGLDLKAAKRARALITVETGASGDDISDAVKELQKDMPTLFEKPAGEGTPPPHSNPGKPAPGTQGAPQNTVEAKGSALFQKRHPQRKTA